MTAIQWHLHGDGSGYGHGSGSMMWGLGWGNSWVMWLLMALAMVAFWAVVILAIRALWRSTQRSDDPVSTHRPEPLALLKESLARGDIDPEEYEQRRRILSDGA